MYKSILLYQQYLQTISQTLIQEVDLVEQVLKRDVKFNQNEVKRFHVYGHGSSGLSASVLTGFINKYSNSKAFYSFSPKIGLPRKRINVLISYSGKTYHVKEVIRESIKHNVPIIVFTNNTSIAPELPDQTPVIKIFPDNENLFARPNSAITATLAALIYFDKYLGLQLATSRLWLKTFIDGVRVIKPLYDYLINNVDKNSKIVILHSSLFSFYVRYLILSLREGSGLVADSYDLREFIHGFWVPEVSELNKKKNLRIVILASDKDENMVDRLGRFLTSLGVSFYLYVAPPMENEIIEEYALMTSVVITIDNFILDFVKKVNYDLNNPYGKEAIKKIYE